MTRKVIIIGAGITGLTCAYVLNRLNSKLDILVVDAGPEPRFESANTTYLRGHTGATLGHGRDARHFTGTEGLSFQNPIHTRLLYESAGPKVDGWCAIPESALTRREKRWRQECLDRYQQHVTPEYNPYDEMYTTLNYGGMEAWSFLASLDQTLTRFRLSSSYVYVAFQDEEGLQADFASESRFNPFNTIPKLKVSLIKTTVLHDDLGKVLTTDHIRPRVLRVPGSTWRIQSVWKYFYDLLLKEQNITFKWKSTITHVKQLPSASLCVWSADTTRATPDIYQDHGRVQGIGGWWLSLQNQGFKVPFKISAPQPSGYINFTPQGKLLHISGGFGWIGERGFQEARELLTPAKKQLLTHLSLFLRIPKSALEKYDIGCCIRPTTPTGLPDVQTLSYGGRDHIMISGAGKAGATQAPLLALHVARTLGLNIDKQLQTYKARSTISGNVLNKALNLLIEGLEPTDVYSLRS